MTTQTLERFRRTLLSRRTRLVQHWRQALSDQNEVLAAREADWAGAATAATTLERIGDWERAALARIQSSLARIERGTYDECASCHGVIDEERLGAVPDTDRCTACAPRLN